MNLKHPYEKHLAEKLVQLPPPGDPDQNWQQMKSLLDKDMPRGGGGMLGATRWLIPGIIVIAILTGIWFGGKQFLPMNQNNKSMAGTINKTKNNKDAEGIPANETKEIPASPVVTVTETSPKELVAGTVPVSATADKPKIIERSRDKTTPPAVATKKNTIQPETTSKANNNEIIADRKKVYSKKNNKRKTETPAPEQFVTEVMDEPPVEEEEVEEPTHFVSLPSVHVPKPSTRPTTKSTVKASPVDIIVDYTGTATITPSGVLQRNYTYYSQADLFPELVAQKRSSSRRSGRAYESHDDRTFAIGLSLPLGFPLGDQEPLAYNRQAGVNTISDYIPSPHVQYHINSRTYFQTQVQMWSPQFIRPILLYQTVQSTAQPNTFLYHSVYARKLYYFNLPVSVYHSPMRNFYMGTGLQFSSMLSGVALFEERQRSNMVGSPQDYIISQKYARFANDTLSHRFNGNEVRLLLDMNYYWNRFIVGLQYNQAFNNYVSFQMNSVSPYTFDKNKSLQFYLRYNIWEDKKRKRKSETMLSLK